MPYAQITFGQLKAALLQRLQDTSAVFTLDPEAGLYICEALQTLNALTAVWNADQKLDFSPGDTWKSLNFSGSFRERTITDADIYVLMEYHLLEPPSGPVWTGTTQFNITNLSQALQYRRDELLQASGANMVNFLQASPVNTPRSTLPDTLLDLRRVRWVPNALSGIDPYVLGREDVITGKAYGNNLILAPGPPDSWWITSTPPLTFDVSSIPNVTGTWDILALESGVALAPPAVNVLGLPDDWCWVAKWGALADVLANSPEGTDNARAKYCIERYKRGMKAMVALPWLLNASVAKVPTDTVSVQEADAYAQNWEENQPIADPQIVVGGMDLVSLAPNVTPSGVLTSSLLTVVQNAPIPSADSDPIQLSQDGVDAILNYAQHLAMFKAGGAEFMATLPLYAQFEAYCAATNDRYAALGIVRPEMLMEGDRGEMIDPRFLTEETANAQ